MEANILKEKNDIKKKSTLSSIFEPATYLNFSILAWDTSERFCYWFLKSDDSLLRFYIIKLKSGLKDLINEYLALDIVNSKTFIPKLLFYQYIR